MSVCVPGICRESTISAVMEIFIANVNHLIDPSQPLRCTRGDKPQFGALEWTALAIFLIILILVIASTIYESTVLRRKSEPDQLFAAFSLHTNVNRLLRIGCDPGSLECLNGLRVVSTLWIVLLHSYDAYRFMPTVYNPNRVEEFRSGLGRAVVSQATLAVDTFFVIGGMVNCIGFLRAKQKGETFSYPKYVLHRLVRVAPALFAAILFIVAFVDYLGDGPAWWVTHKSLIGRCERYWWSSLLFIQNWVNPFDVVSFLPFLTLLFSIGHLFSTILSPNN